MPRKRRRDEDGGAAAAASSSAAAAVADDDYAAADDAAADDGNDAGALARQVYVEGLPYSASEADIAKFFAGCGDVEGIKAPRWQDTGRLRGYAHVTFTSAAAASKALERDGRYLGDRFINVARARPTSDGAASALATASRPRPQGCATLFVKNLPYEWEEEAVKAAFAPFGKVASVRLPRWNNTGRVKGSGYVQFESGLSCEAAMKAFRAALEAGKRGLVLAGSGGRAVGVDYDTGAPRSSFKTASGQSFFKTDEAALVKKAVAKVRGGPAGAATSSSSSSSSAAAAADGEGDREARREKKAKKAKRDRDADADGGDEY
jgi:nucleolin